MSDEKIECTVLNRIFESNRFQDYFKVCEKKGKLVYVYNHSQKTFNYKYELQKQCKKIILLSEDKVKLNVNGTNKDVKDNLVLYNTIQKENELYFQFLRTDTNAVLNVSYNLKSKDVKFQKGTF